ncbi:MAG: GNAT family N-acetyltransferase [Candidatus Thiodiazotropha sp. (ex Codakia rugifera)]|nr:GNAT family N-acetyltransferase [Candidatus Thiodiazotropha sp. (ex Codakia rugifera)]
MLADKTYIEFARLSDVAEISRISRDEIEYGLGWDYTSGKLTQLIKNSSKNVVVARIDKKLVGFGIMTYRKDQANLDLLAVKEGFRRKKIGTQIVLWLEKVAITSGIFNIFVQVRKRNPGALVFYEHLGFRKLDEIRGLYNDVENGVVMVKLLRSMVNTT